MIDTKVPSRVSGWNKGVSHRGSRGVAGRSLRLLCALFLAGFVVAALSACGGNPTPDNTVVVPTAATSQSLTKVTIALGYIPDVQFAPFYLALEKGYYREEGLDVTFKHGIVTDLITQLGVGADDTNFAVASGDELIPARLQGIPVKYVMTWYRQYPVAAASIKGKGPALTSPADLKGKVVGVPGQFGATYIGLQALLKAGGLKLGDVQLKTIGFSQAASLSQGQVDVAMVYAANEPTQLRSQNYDVTTLLVSDYSQLASNGLITNDKTLSERPELVQRVVRATLMGIRDTIADPQAAFAASLKQIPELGSDNSKQELQLQVLKETIKLMQPKPDDPATGRPLGWTDAEVWRSTQDALLEFKVITQKGDVGEMFTNQFVEK